MSRNPVQHSVLECIAERWSPYRFEPTIVEDEKIIQCLEAARWAASSFNDQPWSWVVVRRQDQDFDRAISCLMEANQSWAKNAGVLIFTFLRSQFAYNQKPNRVALHDLGQAACQLSLQACAAGLQAHQMAGVNLTKVRLEFEVPDEFEPQTAIALGYPDFTTPELDADKQLQQRDNADRKRHPLAAQVFGRKWAQTPEWM